VKRKSVFNKSDIQVVNSDWDGSETYWTQTGKNVLETAASPTPPTAVIRYLESNVDATSGGFDLDFPDDDSHSAGNFTFNFTYATVFKREIHILSKEGVFPTKLRIDYFSDATTKIAQIYMFQVTSDPKSLKYGIQIRFLVIPSSFDLFYDINDEQHFSTMGILLEDSTSVSTSDPATVAGVTYFPSMPLAYVPGGVSQLGYASDAVARIVGLAALAVAIIAIIYMTIYSN